MSTRKAFLTAAASSALVAAAPPSPAPTASPQAKPKVSQLARDFAERMREFDPHLTGKDLEAIAAGIQQNLESGKYVNPKGRILKNSDEPDATFQAAE